MTSRKAKCHIMCDGCGDIVPPGQDYFFDDGLLFCVPYKRSKERDDSVLGALKCGLET